MINSKSRFHVIFVGATSMDTLVVFDEADDLANSTVFGYHHLSAAVSTRHCVFSRSCLSLRKYKYISKRRGVYEGHDHRVKTPYSTNWEKDNLTS